jgi:hypothetical protein
MVDRGAPLDHIAGGIYFFDDQLFIERIGDRGGDRSEPNLPHAPAVFITKPPTKRNPTS